MTPVFGAFCAKWTFRQERQPAKQHRTFGRQANGKLAGCSSQANCPGEWQQRVVTQPGMISQDLLMPGHSKPEESRIASLRPNAYPPAREVTASGTSIVGLS